MKFKEVFTARGITLVGLSIALIFVGSFIKIPNPLLTLTLQIQFILLISAAFGPWISAIATILYLIIGLLGLPVFAGGGGFQYVFSPTFGYLLGMVSSSIIFGYLTNRKEHLNKKDKAIAIIVTLGTLYLLGVLYQLFIFHFYLDKDEIIAHVVLWTFFLCLPKDIILTILTFPVSDRIKKIIRK